MIEDHRSWRTAWEAREVARRAEIRSKRDSDVLREELEGVAQWADEQFVEIRHDLTRRLVRTQGLIVALWIATVAFALVI